MGVPAIYLHHVCKKKEEQKWCYKYSNYRQKLGVINNLFSIRNSVSTKGTKGETGTGLGLIIVHEFVNKHGGSIWAESEIGKGSVFNFLLPFTE